MLQLTYRTPPEWVGRIGEDPLALLADHAHCELKAAASAQALIVKNAGRPRLVAPLSALAREELEHFERVHTTLRERGGELGPAIRSPYAEGLIARANATRRDALLDRLLVAALIEARSLERFHLLATGLEDAELARLYAELLKSEARHRTLFVRFARDIFPADLVEERLTELLELEAELVRGLPFSARVHSGIGSTPH